MGDKIKALALAHGEKIGTGVVAVIVVLLVWAAIGRDGLEPGREPDDLKAKAQAAKSNIDRSVWDEEYDRRPEFKQYDDRSIMDNISPVEYKITKRLDPPLFEEKVKREDPVLLAALDLEVHAGFGPFALVADENVIGGGLDPLLGEGPAAPRRPGRPPRRGGEDDAGGLLEGGGEGLIDGGEDPIAQPRPLPAWAEDYYGGIEVGGGARVEGRRWAVVNAIVPIAAQLEIYEDVFRGAEGFDPTADIPEYVAYFVERADVTRGTAPTWKQVAVFTPTLVGKATEDWAMQAQEVIDPNYFNPLLVFPLGPRLLKDWGEDVTHSQVPLAPTAEELEQQRLEEGDDNPIEPEGDDNIFDQFGQPAAPRPGPGGRGQQGSMRRPPVQRPPVGRGGPRINEGGVPGQMGVPQAPHLLLRFFDFEVRPGHSYQYRVRLVMADPNYYRGAAPGAAPGEGVAAKERPMLPEKHLSKDAIERRRAVMKTKVKGYRFTDWSEASPAVYVPFESRVLAGDVKSAPVGRFTGEPSAKVVIEYFDPISGVTAVKTVENMDRGGVGNFIDQADVIDPATRQIIPVKEQEFETSVILLDMRGGDRMLRSDKRPGEILFMNPSGQLEVRTEPQDEEEILFYKDLFDPAEDAGLLEGGGPGLGIPGAFPGGGLLDGPQPRDRRRGTRAPRGGS
jgi:hypothetical protein